jgi:hypothetical protein
VGGGAGDGSGTAGPTEPGERCESDGPVRACSTAHPELVLQCDAGVWALGMLCRPGDRCKPSVQRCAPLAPECVQQPQGLCVNDGPLLDCATNPFNPIDRYCPFGCANGVCLPGTGDQLIVHTELQTAEAMPWLGEIPVCFADDPGAKVRRWTRSAVEQGWARYLDVEFTGWEDCASDDVSGVILEFPRGCRGRIASPVSHARDEGRLRVGICASYFDAGDAEQELDQNEALARFVARHQFGHVLGLGEGAAGASSTVMVRSLRATDVDPSVSVDDIAKLRDRYGYKPKGAIVHVSGWCLSASGTAVGLAPCSKAPAQVFNPLPDRIEGEGGKCLVINGYPQSPVVELADCTPSPPTNALALRRALWNAPGHCVAPREPSVVPGAVLETQRCTVPGDPLQTWRFEITGSAAGYSLARLRLAALDYCVVAPRTFRVLDDGGVNVPTLEPCGTASTLLTLGPDGDISFIPAGSGIRHCLDWSGTDSVVHFRYCSGRSFMLSGPLETADGLALSSIPDDALAGLSVLPPELSEVPGTGEVFDVHF